MTVERRLHHAARELREVEIDVPPLGAGTRRRSARMLQGVAAPLLFAAGVVFAYGAVQSTSVSPTHTDVDPVPVVGAAVTGEPGEPVAVTAPSVRVEMQLIAELLSEPDTAGAPTPTGPATGDRMADGIGPI